MTFEDIEYVIREFGPARWTIPNNAVEGVFLIKVTPLPPPDQLERVIADICIGGIPVYVSNGKVYHSKECQTQRHVIQNATVKRSIRKLKEETFNIAIYPNISIGPLKEEPILGGQPVAIAFDPAISFMNYPDHPHLNIGNPERLLPGTKYLIPDTLCYTNKPNELGNIAKERLMAALDDITIWLLRHQIWVATRELTGHGIWIGPYEGQIEPENYPLRLNPQGSCHCSRRKTYASCHMAKDIEVIRKKYGDRVALAQTNLIISGWWPKAVYSPQIALFNTLKQC